MWSVLAAGWGLGVLTALCSVFLLVWADTSPGGEG